MSEVIDDPRPWGDPGRELSWLIEKVLARLTPADYGDMWTGKPTDKVRQHHVCHFSNVSKGHFTNLRKGDVSIRYSAEVLEGIARGMRMSASERYYLWWAATGHAAPGQHPATDELDRSAIQIVEVCTWPAWLLTPDGEILACNKFAVQQLPAASSAPNLFRWMLLDPAARTALPEWESRWVPALLLHLRMAAAMASDDERLLGLLADIRASDPLFTPLWDQNVVGCREPAANIQPGPLRLIERDGELLPIHMTTWEPPGRSDRLMLMLQEAEETCASASAARRARARQSEVIPPES